MSEHDILPSGDREWGEVRLQPGRWMVEVTDHDHTIVNVSPEHWKADPGTVDMLVELNYWFNRIDEGMPRFWEDDDDD